MAIFKLAGGKGKMLKRYEPYFSNLTPTTFVDYFGGTGSVSVWFKEMYPKSRIILNEISPEVHGIHKVILNHYKEFSQVLKTYDYIYSTFQKEYTSDPNPNHKRNKSDLYKVRQDFYLRLRDRYADTDDFYSETEKYATLYFMLQTNFNGIWQCRKKDRIYYTPFGNGDESGSVIKWDEIDRFRNALLGSLILNLNYVDLFHEEKNSVHYFDPPYVSSFTEFSDDFSEKDTKHLCDRINVLDARRHTVFFSNKQHELFERVLSHLRFELFDVQYTAGRSNKGEGSKSVEILAHNNLHANG